MSKITESAISRKLLNQKKGVVLENIFLQVSANFWVKIQNTQATEIQELFRHLGNQHLMVQQMAKR